MKKSTKDSLKILLAFVVVGVLSYAGGKDSVYSEIIETSKLNRFYVDGEGTFRLQCTPIKQETITRDVSSE